MWWCCCADTLENWGLILFLILFFCYKIGNAKTSLVINIAPCSEYLQESLSSLHFGSRVCSTLSLSSQSHSLPWFSHKVATKKLCIWYSYILACSAKQKAEVTTNDEVHWNIHDGCFLDGEEMAGNEGCHQGHHQCGRGISGAHSESARNTGLAGWETAKPWGMYFLCNPFLENILKFQTSFHLLCEQAHFLKL